MLKDIAVMFGGFILVCIILVLGGARIESELNFPGEYAAIEQLRMDVARTKIGTNEDVIGQVTQANQRIKTNQQYRSIWWSHHLVASGWDKVELIPIPEN